MLTPDELLREAAATGFQSESLEKAIRLLELLQTLCSHPFLKARIVLKGGTALNLFVLDVPRLSVDIDLNYIGTADRETMLAEKPKLEESIQAVCGRLGMQVRRSPTDHAGGKWRLSYTSATGRTGTLELDLNFMLRTPLWTPGLMESRAIASSSAKGIPVLDIHELAAGKLAALFARGASRDLFDAGMLAKMPLDRGKLRLAFVVYGGINRKDWRTVDAEKIKADIKDVENQLVPMLRADLAPPRRQVSAWRRRLVTDCRELLYSVVPLADNELEFLTKLNDFGEIAPELLTEDRRLQTLLRTHPGLLWKAQNVIENRKRQ